MNKAVEFRSRYSDTAELMTALDAAGVQSDQNWDTETTYWSFDDGSEIAISGAAVIVIDRQHLANELLTGVPDESRADHEAIAEAIAGGESWATILRMPELDRWPETYSWLTGEIRP